MPKPLAAISHLDLYGRRNEKYNTLETLSVQDAEWTALDPVEPYYFFVPKDFGGQEVYEKGFKIDELFENFNTGIQTKRDKISISFDEKEVNDKIAIIKNNDEATIIKIFDLPSDGRDWTLMDAKKDILNSKILIKDIFYRPFDFRKIIYTGKTKGIVAYPRHNTSKHLLSDENISFITLRLNGENETFVSILTKYLVEKGSLASGNYSFFPLYLYSDSENINGQTKMPNLNATIWSVIDEAVGRKTTPEEVLDYIYAVLHSPSYREKYREFLKIDFPRVPYPTSQSQFESLVGLGGELRELHLLESSKVEDFITSYPIAGDNVVESVKYVNEKVFINATQYFGGVPAVAWNFYIGGYQPAQKWLKDRKGRTLTNDDIMHYQRMIVALFETARVMGEVDRVIVYTS